MKNSDPFCTYNYFINPFLFYNLFIDLLFCFSLFFSCISNTVLTIKFSQTSQDSYSLCRIFKKTIQIPSKSKEEEQAEDAKKVSEEDSSGTEISREIETLNDKVLNYNNEYPKLPCDASSSDVTQGTCTPADTCIADDFQPQFTCDEANSASISYSMGIGYPSNSFQVTFYLNTSLSHIHFVKFHSSLSLYCSILLLVT